MMGPIKKAPLTIVPAGILNHMTYLTIVIKLLNFLVKMRPKQEVRRYSKLL
jgi:hypothetical protein